MKKFMKKMLAVVAALATVFTMAGATASAAEADKKVTVSGIAAGDQVALYQVLREDKSSSNGWSVTDQFSGAITLAEVFNGITSNEAETIAETASNYSYTSAASGTSVELTVDPGMYLVLVTPADSNTIYNPAFVANDYNSRNGSNAIDLSAVGYTDSTVMKKASVTVDKKANEEDSTDKYSVGDVVPFTITTVMPSYPSNSTNATMVITDTPEGLDIDLTSLEVNVDGVKVAPGPDTYTSSIDTSSGALTITFAKSYILANPAKNIIVSYKATLNTVNTTTGKASNKAEVTFNRNPNTETTVTPNDTVVESTYGVVFKKVDGDGIALAGAGFTLYAGDVTTNEKVDASKVNAANVAGQEVISGVDGYVSWSGLKAGTYTIVETTTPAGYVTAAPKVIALSSETAVHDNPATADITETNYDTRIEQIPNIKGNELPSTGGMGTTIFYALGAALAIGAGVILVTRKRLSK